MMKRLNFKEFSMPSGISRTNWLTVDVREQVADLLYTHANGIKAHRLAFKILDSTGEEKYGDVSIHTPTQGVTLYLITYYKSANLIHCYANHHYYSTS